MESCRDHEEDNDRYRSDVPPKQFSRAQATVIALSIASGFPLLPFRIPAGKKEYVPCDKCGKKCKGPRCFKCQSSPPPEAAREPREE